MIISFLSLLILFRPGDSQLIDCAIGSSYSLMLRDGTMYSYLTCDVCFDGYFQQINQTIQGKTGVVYAYICTECSLNCLTCDISFDHCLTCPTGTFLDSASFYCENCSSYGPECVACDISQCTQCITGYALSAAPLPNCQPCSSLANCELCTDGLICTICATGYIIDLATVNHDCFLCSGIANCISCIDGPECILCDTNFVLATTGPGNGCVQCPSGYYAITADTCSSCGILNCATCADLGNGLQCQTCESPYELDNGTNSCAENCQYFFGSKCVTCDTTNCLTCVPDYALPTATPNICTPCSTILNCQACTNGLVCTQCLAGFYHDFSTPSKDCVACSSIANCLSCQDGPQCIQCTTNYVLSTASPGNTCNLCSPTGFYISLTGQCLTCPTGCATCSNPITGIKCDSCTSMYILNNTFCAMNCAAMYGTGCATCDGTSCLTCDSGYGFPTATPTICTACTTLNNCQICFDGLLCFQCVTGFFHNYSSPTQDCVTCSTITNCISCQDGPQCIQCATNYILSAAIPANTCNPCAAGSYSSSSTSCSPCPTGCATCSPQITGLLCQSCTLPYTLNSTLCTLKCPILYGTGCLTCNPTNCLTCLSGFAFPTATPTTCAPCSNLANCLTCTQGLVCSQCSSGLVTDFSTPNRACVSCSIPHCILCKNGPQCIQCKLNYVLTTTGPLNGCVTCLPGFYASSTAKCSPCPAECATCSNSDTGIICPTCNSIAIFNPTLQTCIKCDLLISHCSQCQSLSVCTICQYPYKLGQTKICDQCESGFQHVDGFCTKSSGCQIYLPNESRCLTCFAQHHFFYNPIAKGCKCKTGYYETNVSGIDQCLSKCGDGILIFGSEACDDGNLRNDDGCNDQCQKESDFTCTEASPSQCTFQFTPTKFEYNYAYRYEGENRCRFSLSLHPSNPGLKYVDWASYLTFNISDHFIVKNSKVLSYFSETNELTIDFEYMSTIQGSKVQFKLSFDSPVVKMAQTSSGSTQKVSSDNFGNSLQNTQTPRAVSQASSMFPLLQSSKEMTLLIDISGVNSKLVYENETILKVYKGACIGSLVITILILLQFFIGSYFHKMIGIQTLQILQFFYFVRIIIDQHLSTFLNSMNVFKYAAYGGYSNHEVIYGSSSQQVQSLTYMTINQHFVMVGLMKYFSLNTNISLVIPLLASIGFLFTMGRKYMKRNQYLQSLEQSVKDQYTTFRRSSQWVYDHFVFPYINIFNMIVFFSTILYLQSQSATSSSSNLQNSSSNKLIEITSFLPHLTIAFFTFFIYCSEVFQSYEEFQHSRLTEAEKARVPKSIYEKLEHDENNPDRPNYKPGYVLFYLVFYFVAEVVLMLDVLLEPLKNFGVEIMLIVSFVYLVFVWKWKPYNEAVDFHNKALRFNHFTVFLFMVISVFSNRLQMNPIFYLVLICLILIMLTFVSLFGYIRIGIQYKFRKQLLDNPNLMNNRKARPLNQSNQSVASEKKQALLGHNRFAFENQVRIWFKEKSHLDLIELTPEQIQSVKIEIRKQLYQAERSSGRKNQWTDLTEQMFGFEDLFKKQFKQQTSNSSKEVENQKQKQLQAPNAELPTKPLITDKKDHETLVPTPTKNQKMAKNYTLKK